MCFGFRERPINFKANSGIKTNEIQDFEGTLQSGNAWFVDAGPAYNATKFADPKFMKARKWLIKIVGSLNSNKSYNSSR